MDPKLATAAKTGDTEFLLRSVGKDPLLLEMVALTEAETPLHIASMCGHLAFVREMVSLRKQFAFDLNQDGFTPLHLASANGHLEIVHELLKIDLSLCTVPGFEGKIALHCAVVKGRVDVMKELLAASPSSVEMKTARGETALHIAVKNNQFGAYKVLLEHVKNLNKEQMLNEKDEQGNTVLHHAASRKQYQVIHLLLVEYPVIKSQVDVNCRNNRGMTPLDVLLQFQSEASDLEIHSALLKAGAKTSENDHVVDDSQIIPTSNGLIISQESIMNNDPFLPYKLADVNGALSTVLALIIAATYQAVLSPVGGLWQDYCNETHPCSPGKSILATKNPVMFLVFIFGNNIAFYLSLNAVHVLIDANNAYSIRAIRYSLSVISFTYAFSASSIVPESSSLLVWGVFGINILLTVIMLTPCLRAKLWLPTNLPAQENPNP